MARIALALGCALLVLCPARTTSAGDDVEKALLARFAENPTDADTLVALGTHYADTAGKPGHARRYFRAFLRIVLQDKRRVAVAKRVAELLPASAYVRESGDPDEGEILTFRNQLDGSLAVQVDKGPYVRHLRIEHPKSADTDVRVHFEVNVDTFLIDLYETPSASWQWFLLESGSTVPAYWGPEADAYRASLHASNGHGWTWCSGTFHRPNHPAWPLSWHEARALARSAGKRLPTEAQWEKAARGGTDLTNQLENPYPRRTVPWGPGHADGVDTVRVNASGPNDTQQGPGDDRSIPVDALPQSASPYGCRNMLGNVQEWCRDWYWSDEHVFRTLLHNPFAATMHAPSSERGKIIKGGYFNDSASHLSIDERRRHTHDDAGMALLFKCALRGSAAAPPDDDGETPADLDRPRFDPLDGTKMLDRALALEEDHPLRAWHHARAAARLLRYGPAREIALEALKRLRPTEIWKKESAIHWRNAIDGGRAVRDGHRLVDLHEISEGQYLTFLAETARSSTPSLGIHALRYGNGDLPAATLSHADAAAYAAWAGKRLPTRSEWYAIARVKLRKFPWGNTPAKGHAVIAASLTDEDEGHWDRRRPVGSFPSGASPRGVLDLVGNVSEWCADGPEAGAHWLVGGDIGSRDDFETRGDFEASFQRAVYDTEHDIHTRMFAGARCVATAPE